MMTISLAPLFLFPFPFLFLFLFPLRPLRPCGPLLPFPFSPGSTGRWAARTAPVVSMIAWGMK